MGKTSHRTDLCGVGLKALSFFSQSDINIRLALVQLMVFISDEGSTFKAPLSKIWELNQSEGEHSHPSLRNQKAEQQGEHVMLTYETAMPDGTWVRHKTRTTAFPPLGIAFETLEGPMAGSRSFQYYSPRGNETGVTVVGEYTSKGIPDADLKNAVMAFLEQTNTPE